MTTSGHAEQTDLEQQSTFESIEQVTERFRQQGYIVDHRLATMIFLTTRLEKPVLIEGPAGVGKTQLAKSLAETTGRRLIRLQCYEGLDASQVLYEWDYGKQLLYTQLLKDKTNSELDSIQDHGHDHGDERHQEPTRVTMSEEPSDTEDPSHSHSPPSDIADLFDTEYLAVSYSIHKEAGKTDLSALSQQLILNQNQDALNKALDQLSTQINVRRLSNPGMPGDLASGDPAAVLDADLSVGAVEALQQAIDNLDLDEELVESLRAQVDGMIDRLPELLRKYLERLMAQGREMHLHADEIAPAYRAVFTEAERQQMEELLRRLGRKVNGALSSRRSASSKGRINIARTMRSNLKYQGMPFKPILTNRKEDRPRLVVLADVSLSVRNTSRFALHLVHNLQSLFSNVRTFAFVADLQEITEYFEYSPLEEVLGMIFGGEILDVDANSNYGLALENFYENFMTSISHRTTVLVLGDGRGNGHPANAWVLEEMGRRARQLIWFTPEQRGYWPMGGGDMPTYAKVCDRVEVVRGLDQLDEVVDDMVTGALAPAK